LTDRSTLVLVPSVGCIDYVVVGSAHSLLLTRNGEVFATGSNTHGQLGDGTHQDRHGLILVRTNVKSIAAGSAHSVFLHEDGSAYTVGWNGWGQLGDGSTTSRVLPILATTGVKAVAAAASHTFFHMEDGSVQATGANDFGQLGIDRETCAGPSEAACSNFRTRPFLAQADVRSIIVGPVRTVFVKENTTVVT